MWLSVLSLACAPISGEGGKETGDTGDTGKVDAWPCADDEGEVTGVVTVDGELPRAAYVEAYVDRESVARVDVSSADGSYAMCLAEGTYTFAAFSAGCDDSSWADVVAREVVTVDLEIDSDCDTIDKPNLYLYPSQPTRTTVRVEVDPRQRIFASEPPYERGWRGVAMPDGRFVTHKGPAPFLFYEATLLPRQVTSFQRHEGWCLDAEPLEAVYGMAAILERYGFNAAEVDDFVEGWRFDLPRAGAYTVYPQLDVDDVAGLRIDPPLPVERLWLLVADSGVCDSALPEPAVFEFDRSGPHAVEWGVALVDVIK